MKFLITCGVLLLAVCAQTILANAYHVVGDAEGWRPDHNYNEWAKAKEFHMGDVLAFCVPILGESEGYSVQEVSRRAMNKCDGDNPLYEGFDGNTQIPLKTAGTHFFICSDFNLCPDGMNMTITVTN